MSEFQPFLMERFMSAYEQDVEFNLSESGVFPLTLKELLAFGNTSLDELLDTELNYPHVNKWKPRVEAKYCQNVQWSKA